MNGKPEHLMSRRRMVAVAGAGSAALLLRPYLLLGGGASGAPDVEPQPYFAGVNRAIGELAALGAPLSPKDAAQIAALALHGDSASVDLAEVILDRYTLARISVDPGGAARLSPGGAPRTLVEQGWRMFRVCVGNPSGRKDGFELIQAGFRTPGRMMGGNSVAQRSTLLDTLNKGPLIEKMWIMAQL